MSVFNVIPIITNTDTVNPVSIETYLKYMSATPYTSIPNIGDTKYMIETINTTKKIIVEKNVK